MTKIKPIPSKLNSTQPSLYNPITKSHFPFPSLPSHPVPPPPILLPTFSLLFSSHYLPSPIPSPPPLLFTFSPNADSSPRPLPRPLGEILAYATCQRSNVPHRLATWRRRPVKRGLGGFSRADGSLSTYIPNECICHMIRGEKGKGKGKEKGLP